MLFSALSSFICLALAAIVAVTAPTSQLNNDTSTISPLPEVFARGAKGLNCEGSAMCRGCEASLDQLIESAKELWDNGTWANGEKIVCKECMVHVNGEGLCAFARNLEPDERINGTVVKKKLRRLRKHGCKRCGSCPLRPGNVLKTGMVTVNYVRIGCGDGNCGEGLYPD